MILNLVDLLVVSNSREKFFLDDIIIHNIIFKTHSKKCWNTRRFWVSETFLRHSPVNTRRRYLDVNSTFIERYGCLNNVVSVSARDFLVSTGQYSIFIFFKLSDIWTIHDLWQLVNFLSGITVDLSYENRNRRKWVDMMQRNILKATKKRMAL